MKNMIMLIAVAILLVAGCDYESPLTEEHKIAVDPAVIGLWKSTAPHGGEMLILKFSDTEYLVYMEDFYLRGYPVDLGGIAYVQVQDLGNGKGKFLNTKKQVFTVVVYRLEDDQLEVRNLNTELVDSDLMTTKELRKAFLKHKDNKDLFKDWQIFKRHETEGN